MAIPRPGEPPRKKRPFSSTDHLSPEAVAAFADSELSPTALHRARVHIVKCEECRGAVSEQRAAAERLRHCDADGEVRAPLALVERLAKLPAESAGQDISYVDRREPYSVAEFVGGAYRALLGRGHGGTKG
ncbi:hypothetical protein [Corynebacterium liangguodongii]|uniref:Uncharacterized protein n=1 Tax=Corynebacterium liangguodongii TaxID=2079535 RepID=A0A2S0WDE8_9CORY|nr:hypothetical protein [Corynebacterium liangguodongii]AWB83797.1 hypothetical protein C3E79_04280 [Corynebacterium liangguodongii]PWB98918.1 hypothetical protein DF219_08970 [Corynebacterium liangguodongii]